MKVIKLRIEIEANLVDALGDYLIGIHDAAVELPVTDGDCKTVLQAFLERDTATTEELSQLAEQISSYGSVLAELFSCSLPLVSVELVEDQDWAENWKVHFKPFAIVPGLVIVPTWESYRSNNDERVIVMDPGMAFGTGHHATTRLCLEFLGESSAVSAGGEVLDVGTGTGILAMAALLFGASRAVAIDNDAEAVKAAKANSDRNKLSGRMEISGTSLKDIGSTFQVVTANIVHDVLLELSEDLARVTQAGGSLILSGLLDGDQSDSMVRCFAQKGFVLAGRKTAENWSSLLLAKNRAGGG